MKVLRVEWTPPEHHTVYGYRLHAKPLPPCPATLGPHKRFVEVPCPDELVDPKVLKLYTPQITVFAITPAGEIPVPVKAGFVDPDRQQDPAVQKSRELAAMRLVQQLRDEGSR